MDDSPPLVPPTTFHAPTFALPKPQPPGQPLGNMGINPPTIPKLEAEFTQAKPGTPAHMRSGQLLAKMCRTQEVAAGDAATTAAAKVDAKPADKAAKEELVQARKAYERMRECVTRAYRTLVDADGDFGAIGNDGLYALAAEYDDRRKLAAEDVPLIEADRQKALAAWLEIIKRYPKSKYVPAAYRRFADLYFEEAMVGKVDWELSKQAYLRVRDQSDPATEAEHAYARYRLGYVFWNEGNVKEAKKSLREAVDVTMKYPAVPDADAILTAASGALAQIP